MWWKKVVAAILFIAFVPGVVVTIPSGGKKWTVLIVHAILFVIITHFVMHSLRYEGFIGNYGNSCPASHRMDEATGECHAIPTNSAPSHRYD